MVLGLVDFSLASQMRRAGPKAHDENEKILKKRTTKQQQT
jgi:hypothetical protein